MRGVGQVHAQVEPLVPRGDQVRTVEVEPPLPTALEGAPAPAKLHRPSQGPRGVCWASRERWRQARRCASRKETSGAWKVGAADRKPGIQFNHLSTNAQKYGVGAPPMCPAHTSALCAHEPNGTCSLHFSFCCLDY